MNTIHPLHIAAIAVAAVAALVACRSEPVPTAATSLAGADRLVVIGAGLAEGVAALGAADRVVAIDRTSSLVPDFAGRPDIGMPQNLSAEGILALAPTALLLGDDAGPPAVLEQLKAAGIAIEDWKTNYLPAAALDRLDRLGKRLGLETRATELTTALRQRLAAISPPARRTALFLYARGHRTILAAGSDTAADGMLTAAGFDNVFKDIQGMKPVDAEAVSSRDPAVVIIPERSLASLGGPDGLKAIAGLGQTRAVREGHIIAVADLALLGFGPGVVTALERLTAPSGVAP